MICTSSQRVAMARRDCSVPMRRALRDGLITRSTSVLDYGSGRGGDVACLRKHGVRVRGYDPCWGPTAAPRAADVVHLGYVLNVIQSPAERARVVRSAWRLARRHLIVAVRTDRPRSCSRRGDGCWTGRSFQRYYGPGELAAYLRRTIGGRVREVRPGLAYVEKGARR